MRPAERVAALSLLAPDKRADESWSGFWGRKHDERHGPACRCPWNTYGRLAMPVPGVTFDTVPKGKRIVPAVATEGTGE